jgi:hypothetical protein
MGDSHPLLCNCGNQRREVPGREALLQVLEIDEERRRDVANVISVLPDCFPKIHDWLD